MNQDSQSHRATAEQWQLTEHLAINYAESNCILELRARVEALELAHRVQSGTLTSAEQDEMGVVPVVDMKAAVHRAAAEARDATMDELRAASAEARPGGLVERDPECVASWPDCYEGGYDPRCCRFPKSCSCSVRRSQPGPIPEARPGKRLWERMEEAGRCELADNPMAEQAEFYQAMIREVAAAALQMHPDKNLTWERVALWLHQEADR